MLSLAGSLAFAVSTETSSGPLGSASNGTVTLSSPSRVTCTVTHMTPGDTQASTGQVACTLTVTYGGSLPGYLALDVTIASAGAGSDPNHVLTGAPGLYDGTATGLQVLVKDNQATPTLYMNAGGSTPTPGTHLGGAATTPGSATATGTDLLVSKTAFTSGQSVTFTVDYTLPLGATNAYDGAGTTITLAAHAVQSQGNGSVAACTVGHQCDTVSPGSGPVWS